MTMTPRRDTTVLGAGRFLRLVSVGGWEYVERTNAAAVIGIVAVTDEGRLLLVEQFRPAIGAHVIELPAGLVGDISGSEAEEMETAVVRELEEETGYRPHGVRRLSAGPSSPGLTSEVLHLYWAEGLTRVGPGGGDGDERITVHELPLPSVPQWLEHRAAAGTMVDFKVYTALWWADRLVRR